MLWRSASLVCFELCSILNLIIINLNFRILIYRNFIMLLVWFYFSFVQLPFLIYFSYLPEQNSQDYELKLIILHLELDYKSNLKLPRLSFQNHFITTIIFKFRLNFLIRVLFRHHNIWPISYLLISNQSKPILQYFDFISYTYHLFQLQLPKSCFPSFS